MHEGLLADLFDRLDAFPIVAAAEPYLLGALMGELDQVVSGTATLPERTLASADAADEPPAAKLAWLREVTVAGFRGIGATTTLHIPVGPSLTLVTGRNGSGKSSFAEALERLLTGEVRRWETKSAVWKGGWRNVHHKTGARIGARLQVEGTIGSTNVGVTWKDDAVEESDCTTTGIDDLGWAAALGTFRPFLTHAELEVMLDKPSALYDLLAAVLDIEEIPAAQRALADLRKELELTTKAPAPLITMLLADLAVAAEAAADDDRAARALAALKPKKPDFDAVEAIAHDSGGTSGSDDGGEGFAAQKALAQATSPLEATGLAASALREAAASLAAVDGSSAVAARTTADLLAAALAHYGDHGDGACPVCGAGQLDAAWAAATRAEVGRLHGEAAAYDAAVTASRAALTQVHRLPDVPLATWRDVIGAAPTATAEATALIALADAIEVAALEADSAVTAARAHVAEVEDRWAPLAARLLDVVSAGRAAADAAPTQAAVKAAEDWLKAAHDDLRNARLAPIAEKAKAIWAQLRQESNVSLDGMVFKGQNTSRAVTLDVAVDGASSNALAVMSQAAGDWGIAPRAAAATLRARVALAGAASVVPRTSVSPITRSGVTSEPNRREATPATTARRSASVPPEAIVADVPTTWRSGASQMSFTRRTSSATSAPCRPR